MSDRPLAPLPGAPEIQHAPPNKATNGRKHKTTACEECKKKKLKCRGDPPCQHCAANKIECVVNEMADQRRKTPQKRKLENFKRSEDILNRLVECIRVSHESKVVQLVSLIRSHPPMPELQAWLKENFSRSDFEKSPELRDIEQSISRSNDEADEEETAPRAQRRMLDLKRLADSPVYHVPAKPWTTVTDDDALVSHLISLYFTWTHPFFSWMDREVFIRDMQKGDLQSPYCTPFLVNAMLAQASLDSEFSEVYTVPNDPFSRGEQFYNEAYRLFEEGGPEPPTDLPSIQALMVLFVRLVLMGKDRKGWAFLSLACQAAESYTPIRPADDEEARIAERIANWTVWGNHSQAGTAAASLMKHIPVQIPRRPRVPITHHDPADVWSPYPRGIDPVPGHHVCVFNSWCDLCCIAITISGTLYAGENGVPDSEGIPFLNDAYLQLQGWYNNLPSCMYVETAGVPHILGPHLFYHTTIIQIYWFLQSYYTKQGQHESAASARETSHIHARRIAQLIDIHRERWGIDRMAPCTIQWVTTALFALIGALDSAENRTAFTELATLSRAFSRRFPLGKGIMRMLQITAREMKVSLLEETDALFSFFAAESWNDSDIERFSSFYPHFMSIIKNGPARPHEMATYGLDVYLQKFGTLQISD
ncbi:hypothetical protein BJX70DRAFT_406335 [Aspergillus crustosus]